MFKQIARLKAGASDIVSKHEGGNPRTTGRVYQAVGGLLVADGLIGLENPFSRNKSRPGIFGAFVFFAVGVGILIATPLLVKIPDVDSMTVGSISKISAPRVDKDDEDGVGTCSYVARYAVDGKEYTVRSGYSSSSTCKSHIGEPVDVHYLAATPSRGVVSLGTQKAIRWGGIGFGSLFLMIGLVTFVIRAITLFFGIKLFLRGRRLVKSSPPSQEDDGSTVRRAKEAFMEMRFG